MAIAVVALRLLARRNGSALPHANKDRAILTIGLPSCRHLAWPPNARWGRARHRRRLVSEHAGASLLPVISKGYASPMRRWLNAGRYVRTALSACRKPDRRLSASVTSMVHGERFVTLDSCRSLTPGQRSQARGDTQRARGGSSGKMPRPGRWSTIIRAVFAGQIKARC